MTFLGLGAKTYSYLKDDDNSEDKKAKATQQCVIRKPMNLKIIKTVEKQLNLRIK